MVSFEILTNTLQVMMYACPILLQIKQIKRLNVVSFHFVIGKTRLKYSLDESN